MKVRVHRLECSASSANNVDTFEDKTKNELNDCIKDYDLKISRLQKENKSLLNVIERQIQEISELQMQLKKKALIYDPALSVWVITKSNSSENPRGFNIKFEMYGKKQ